MPDMVRILGATPVEGYRLALEFADEMRGIADLSDVFQGQIDEEAFREIFVQEHAVRWVCGTALSSSELYPRIQPAFPSSVKEGEIQEYAVNCRDLRKIVLLPKGLRHH